MLGERWTLDQYQNRQTHSPVVEWADGSKFWYVDNQLHRLDGPAVEFISGSKHWYIQGQEYTEAEFLLLSFMR